jgi:hypothetical protein
VAVWPVRLSRDGVPEHEWEALSHLESALDDLAVYVNQFRDALSLFDYCLNALSLAQANRSGSRELRRMAIYCRTRGRHVHLSFRQSCGEH